jgi:hypothetical protein
MRLSPLAALRRDGEQLVLINHDPTDLTTAPLTLAPPPTEERNTL